MGGSGIHSGDAPNAHHKQMDDPVREAVAKCILRAMAVLGEQMEDGEERDLLLKAGRNLLRVVGARLLMEAALR